MAVMNLEEFKKNVTDEMIFPALMRADWNEELLKRLPHRTSSDLALYYYIEGEFDMKAITTTIADAMGWSEEWLYETAVRNVTKVATFDTMRNVLAEQGFAPPISAEEPDILYVLTKSPNITLGAGAILSLINSNDDRIKSFKLIPSSIHEWILIPDELQENEAINDMITSINGKSECIAQQDWLSDHVYTFADLSGFANAG